MLKVNSPFHPEADRRQGEISIPLNPPPPRGKGYCLKDNFAVNGIYMLDAKSELPLSA